MVLVYPTMSDTENEVPNANGKRTGALQLGPRKKMHVIIQYLYASLLTSYTSSSTDPLVHNGRHFCRTVHAMCNMQTLLINGILRVGEQAEKPEEEFTAE